MQRYFLDITYLGTPYCGWQRQPNGTSVQETIEQALGTILRQPIPITAAGRTDAGVHALHMTAHLDLPAPHPDTTRLTANLNSLLPPP